MKENQEEQMKSSKKQNIVYSTLFFFVVAISFSLTGCGSGYTQYEVIYTSQNLLGHDVTAECPIGSSCQCFPENVDVVSKVSYGEVISNVRKTKTYVNAIGHKKFTETFPNGNSIVLGIYKYTGQVKLPVPPSPDVNQKENPQAVHMMIQLWDGREGLWDSNNNTLEGTIYWDLNSWTQDGKVGKIKIYIKGVDLPIDTGINITPDTNWHTFELEVDFEKQKYVSMTIDGITKDLSTYELAQVYHGPGSSEPWGKDISLVVTTESLAAWPGEDCTNVFTWTTQFKDLEFSTTPTQVFNTGHPSNPYPSIMGNHTGIIKPNHTVIATKLYTYPCPGTGGHTEYAKIWNSSWEGVEAHWKGYKKDRHNISFDKTFTLVANETYTYTIRTGSYPQIHRTNTLSTANGWINCTEFVDANGKKYEDGIPAIKIF